MVKPYDNGWSVVMTTGMTMRTVVPRTAVAVVWGSRAAWSVRMIHLKNKDQGLSAKRGRGSTEAVEKLHRIRRSKEHGPRRRKAGSRTVSENESPGLPSRGSKSRSFKEASWIGVEPNGVGHQGLRFVGFQQSSLDFIVIAADIIPVIGSPVKIAMPAAGARTSSRNTAVR